ncbi:MAG TPA: hypothetical protein VK668_13120 [Mucilaginibacter sp.]|nr:hypothetical protein [Mucilaginibacter sp.]
MKKISLIQKRFLIIWIIFHSLALFVNVANISGTIVEQNTNTGKEYIYVLTRNTLKTNFWPFTTYNQYVRHIDTISNTPPFINTVEHIDYYYNGIFNSYGYLEYFFYLIIGFMVVYLPKFWSNM